MKKNILNCLMLLCLLSGCSISTHYVQSGATVYSETNAEDIQIYTGDIEEEYQVIGSIAVDVMGNGKAAEKYLKKKASKLGADAVMLVHLTKMNSPAQRTGISGVAVKLNNGMQP